MITVKQWRKMTREEKKTAYDALSEKEKADLKKRVVKARQKRELDAMYKDLGLTKVRGAVSGSVYWE